MPISIQISPALRSLARIVQGLEETCVELGNLAASCRETPSTIMTSCLENRSILEHSAVVVSLDDPVVRKETHFVEFKGACLRVRFLEVIIS